MAKTDVVSQLSLVTTCVVYGAVAWLLQGLRVVAPRDWLRQRIKYLRAQTRDSSPTESNLKWVDESVSKGWWRLSTSRVQAGWRHVHAVEDAAVLKLPKEVVEEQLQTVRTRLAAIPGKEAKAFVKRIDAALKGNPDPESKRALLQEAMIFRHRISDANYEDLATLLDKAVWLTVLALAIVAGLGLLFDREAYFLAGAAGALISRLVRVLRRRPKASDYGAAWSTLVLSPAAGALAGWIGVLVVAVLAADPFNVLDATFAKPWDDATSLLGLVVAFVAGFSERWFNRLLGAAEAQLVGKLPADEAAGEEEEKPQEQQPEETT